MDKTAAQAELELRRRDYPRWLTGNAPSGYTYTWKYQQYIYSRLERVTGGESKRLMVFIPPRHTKSETVTIRYAAWRIINNPKTRVIIACYSQYLANKFSRAIRRIVRASGVELSSERRAVNEWETTHGGGLRAAGVGAGVTGTGADLIIIDDPIKSRKEANSATYRENLKDWYTNDLYTRQEPGCAVIVIQTRWHEDDLSGWLIEESKHGGEAWEVVSLPALAEENDPLGRKVGEALCPERYDETALARIKQTLKNDFWALFQQRPQSAEGNIFKLDWLRYATDLPPFVNVVQAWDTAMKAGQHNDYSACATVGVTVDGAVYVLNVYRAHLETPDLLRQMRRLADEYNPTVILIEDKASGTGAFQTLKRQTALPLVPQPAEGDKEERARLISPYFEGGKVLLCRGAWNVDFTEELTAFPSSANDDMVDALTYALMRAFNRTSRKARMIGRDTSPAPSDRSKSLGEFVDSRRGRPPVQRAR